MGETQSEEKKKEGGGLLLLFRWGEKLSSPRKKGVTFCAKGGGGKKKENSVLRGRRRENEAETAPFLHLIGSSGGTRKIPPLGIPGREEKNSSSQDQRESFLKRREKESNDKLKGKKKGEKRYSLFVLGD